MSRNCDLLYKECARKPWGSDESRSRVGCYLKFLACHACPVFNSDKSLARLMDENYPKLQPTGESSAKPNPSPHVVHQYFTKQEILDIDKKIRAKRRSGL